LASNSLLEGLVFGHRIAETLIERLREPAPSAIDGMPDEPAGGLLPEVARARLQALMSRNVGVLRDAAGLARATDGLAQLAELAARDGGSPGTEAWETTNLLTVAAALGQAATAREDTRGAHWRDDFADRYDRHWCGHLDT